MAWPRYLNAFPCRYKDLYSDAGFAVAPALAGSAAKSSNDDAASAFDQNPTPPAPVNVLSVTSSSFLPSSQPSIFSPWTTILIVNHSPVYDTEAVGAGQN